MSPLALTGLIFGSMLVMMALRVPIAVSMFAAGSLGYVVQTGWMPFSNFLNTQAFARFASYDLSVIPLFILMGHFATKGGISKALFEFAAAVMGRFKGGLAMASLLACARLRRDQRLVGRDRRDDHQRGPARDAPPRLLGPARHRHARRRRHARHPAAALDRRW